MFSLDDMFLFAYKLKTCVFTVPLVYMNIVRKRSERKTTSEDREIFTHPIGVFIAAIVATFYGERIPFIKLSYAELGIQPQELGSKYYLLVIVSSYLGLCFYSSLKR